MLYPTAASPGARFIAHALDAILLNGIQLSGGALGGTVAVMMMDASAGKLLLDRAALQGTAWGLVFWTVAGWILNYGVLQGMSGQSVGKWLVGIKVVNLDGSDLGIFKSMGRTLGYVASAVLCGVGFLALFWSQRSQCWHDAMFGTWVVKARDMQSRVIQLPAPAEKPQLGDESSRKVA